jgi:hypothetical protein
MHELEYGSSRGTGAGVDNTPHHQYAGGLEDLAGLGFRPADVIAMATRRRQP